MNPFQLFYIERLQCWSQLRENLQNTQIRDICITVDEWWQRAPLINHYLHVSDVQNWPNPWQLISDNEYCPVARALGICYTLYMLGITDFELCEAVDEYGDDCIIVRCDKYVLNWYSGQTVNTPLSAFRINRAIDITHLLSKIR